MNGATKEAAGDAPLEILHLVTIGHMTGVAVSALRLARAQHRLGHRVLFAAPPGGAIEKDGHWDEVPHTGELVCSARSSLREVRRAAARLRALLARVRFDVVHVYRSHAHLASWLAGRRGQKAPARVRSLQQPWRSMGPLRRLVARRAEGFVVPEGWSAAQWAAVRAVGKPVAEMPVPVPLEVFNPEGRQLARQALAGRWGLPTEPVLLGMVTKIDYRRGILRVLEGLRLLEARNDLPPWRFFLVGYSKWSFELCRRIYAMNLGHRVFINDLWDQFERQIQALEVHIQLTPGSDGAGRATAEMLAAGAACVVAPHPALEALLPAPWRIGQGDQPAGIVLPDDSPRAIAEALAPLIADEQLRRKMGQAARKLAEERHDSLKIAGELVRFYRRLLKTSP